MGLASGFKWRAVRGGMEMVAEGMVDDTYVSVYLLALFADYA